MKNSDSEALVVALGAADKYRSVYRMAVANLATIGEILGSTGGDPEVLAVIARQMRTERDAFRAALHEIAHDPHCTPDYGAKFVSDHESAYSSGVVDGHRCAATKARAALEPTR